jgi:hypothetical protein
LHRSRFFRLFLFAPLILLLSSSSSVSAQTGLTLTVYDNYGYNNAPPFPSSSGAPIVGTTTVSNVNQDYDGNPLFGMYEDFIVRYQGFITSPVSGSFQLWPQADDGTQLYIDDVLVQNDWVDKGGGGAISEYVSFEAGVSKKFEMWFYENGGGAWTTLYWDIGNGWEIVPESAFGQLPVSTTIPKYLGSPLNVSLTDTGSSIVVNWDASENDINISPERYAISWSTGESGWGVATGNVGDANALNTEIVLDYSLFSSTGGLNAEYSITVRADNDTYSVYSSNSNPVILKIGTTPPPLTTTTTTTTTSTTTTTTTTTIVETTTTEVPLATGTTTSTVPVQTTVLQQAEQPQTTTTTSTTVPLEENVVSITEEITKEQAVSVATNSEVVKTLTSEQATEVFQAIDVEELTPEQAEQLVAAVQNAPEEVREAFEEEINVFSGAVDTYVPVGSSVPIGTRRVIIGISAVVIFSAPPTSRRK